MKCRNLRSRCHLGVSLFKTLHRRDRSSHLSWLPYFSVEAQQERSRSSADVFLQT
ncbi:hypothetical protein QUA40_24420 [Microcoleus sp. Pol11C3]|uniref:hypothetical protein n=1 Tax=Microcoleus sp. Pol11C3 TaxID=3055390 RepID=UPI002FD11B1D